MKAWGPGTFENDEAMEFLGRLLDSSDATALLKQMLRDCTDPDATAAICAQAVAAADIVACGGGRPGLDVPDEVRELLALYMVSIDEEALQLAVHALDAVRGPSRLRDWWLDTGTDIDEWDGAMAIIESRLTEMTLR